MAVPRLNLVLVFLFLAPLRITAEQRYNPTDGYVCNGRDTTCSTFAMYRTFQANETVQAVGSYFNMEPVAIANVSDLAMADPNAPLAKGHALFIPLDCRCENSTSQMFVTRTIAARDTYWDLSFTIYGGLTKYQAMERSNPTKDVGNLPIGDVIRVPIFCACPTVEQIARGTTLLLTHAGESLEVVSGRFGIAVADLSAANQVSENETLGSNITLLVPLASLPPLANLSAGQSPSAPNSSRVSSERPTVGVIAGVCTGAILLVLLVAGFFVARWWRKKKRFGVDGGDLMDHAGLLAPRMFTFKELRKATRNFSSSEMLGRGGFGAVYKATLPSTGVTVAVKRMRTESRHGKESFQAEVASLSHIRHRNLVQLRGWCHEEEQLLLVYDYMCNGSLDQWIFRSEAQLLPLDLRRSVVSGVAAALAYLHEECPQCVLHRDIKCSNVLLDGDWNAYLGDFGLARLIDHQKMEKTTMMAGTFGYIAPEMPHTGKATKESDVYSFGVLLLEVMCGTRALDPSAIERGDGTLVDRVWRAHEAGDVTQVADSRMLMEAVSRHDPVLLSGSIDLTKIEAALSGMITNDVHSSAIISGDRDGAMEPDEKMMIVRNLLHLGLRCCNPNPEERPPMRLVAQLLQGSETMEMSHLPPLPSYNPTSWIRPEAEVTPPSSDWSSFSVPSLQTAGDSGSLQHTQQS